MKVRLDWEKGSRGVFPAKLCRSPLESTSNSLLRSNKAASYKLKGASNSHARQKSNLTAKKQLPFTALFLRQFFAYGFDIMAVCSQDM